MSLEAVIIESAIYKPRKGPSRKSLTRKGSLARKPIKKVPGRKIKPRGVSKLLKEADTLMSRVVRLSAADQEGNVSCFTCGHRNHYKKMQNGHYISRYYKKYRFARENTRIQCAMCNMWKSGDIPTFRQNLIKEIGEAKVLAMESDFKELFRLTPEFLTERITEYQAILNPQ